MSNNLCIYHKNCSDGLAAALILWRLWQGEGDFIPMQYNDKTPLPDVTGRNVYIVDFSFSREEVLYEELSHAQYIPVVEANLSEQVIKIAYQWAKALHEEVTL